VAISPMTMMSNKYIKLIGLFLMLCFCSCNPKYGFIESEFKLSAESRLPKWVDIPSGYKRSELTMTITFYTHPFLKKVKMIVYGPAPEHKVLIEIVGDQRFHPLTEEKPRDYYPRYIIISVKGVEEVFENREPGPVLYVTDDPKVTYILKSK
jgi:hypothetical protein